MGWLEVPYAAYMKGGLNLAASPEVTVDGPGFTVIDGDGASGAYVLTLMAEAAIEKARTQGIAISFGGNHNDGGNFGNYAYMAYENDMVAFTSNNSIPLASPFGGKELLLGCPPFDGIIPSGDEPPIWMSTKLAEFYDGDVGNAVRQGKKLKGKWAIDPETGELTDDVAKYAVPIEGGEFFGRAYAYTCGQQFEHPRTYAQNLFNEGLSSIINPLGKLPWNIIGEDCNDLTQFGTRPTVGGSFYIAINPAAFGDINTVKQKADEFVKKLKESKTRPGKSIRVPSENGYKKLISQAEEVDVLDNYFDPFWKMCEREGLSKEQLEKDFTAGAEGWTSSFK
jgi:LDH2 family malate/lactate/ureidoglycolate dehydrogenase